ncbi:hypothetical protein B0T17DRAFT_581514 [Bombardia bombarda]|uniref:Nuclear pore protein n=1 Tax=Bombardia bombarda TaxID=252184 RepID=A0AA39WHN2_9PEZI|nr:hypothetical protein B0T17DRAFT_581514 [Bombardia bombarda]
MVILTNNGPISPVLSSSTHETDADKVENVTPEPDESAAGKKLTVWSYHIDADLYVKVRESTGSISLYKVCSHIIASASPVWRKMVYSGEYSRPDQEQWVIEMMDADDHAYGLDILFSISHYKFHEIPSRPNVGELYSLAQVAEKYDSTHLLIPYMKDWVGSLNWHVVMKSERNDDDKTLYVAWVLGEGRWFSRVVSKVAHKATIGDGEDLLDAKGQPWKEQALPAVILDMIMEARLRSLKKLEKAVTGPMKNLLDGDGSDAAMFCRSKDVNDETKDTCLSQQLGSLMRGLKIAGLKPFPKPYNYKGSVIDLATTLEGMKAARYKVPGVPPHLDTHASCGIHLKETVQRILSEAVPLNGFIVQQLKLRAQKSGAYHEELFKDLKEVEGQDPSFEIVEDLRLSHVHYKQQEESPADVDHCYASKCDVAIKIEDVES